MRAILLPSALVLLAACGADEPANDPGPVPGPGHQDLVQEKADELLTKLSGANGVCTEFRFAEPVQDEVPKWHFDPQLQGQTSEFGNIAGWRVDYWYTPEFEGFPPQPERHEMAFFGDGELRAIFSEGIGDAPLDLDKWHARWSQIGWRPRPKASSASSR